MKGRQFLTGGIGLIVLCLLISVPVLADGTVSAMGWGTIPLEDPADDVVRYTDSANPAGGILGDYHNELDIISVNMNKGDLCINCNETPLLTANYSYTIYIDITDDGVSDAVITWPSFECLILLNLMTYMYWNSTSESWSDSPSNLSYTFNLGQLALDNIDKAIPSIASAQIGISIVYWGDPTYIYADFAPFIPSGSGDIPGFPLLLALFGLLTLLGLVYLQRDYTI
jgi:hypothetical protein